MEQIILAIVSDIHSRFPTVCARQWNLWVSVPYPLADSFSSLLQFHVYNSALCVGTLVLRDANNAMAAFAVQQIEIAVSLYTSLCQYSPKDRRYRRNLEWLEKLRTRAAARLDAASLAQTKNADGSMQQQKRHSVNENGDAADEFLGWRTRLIERTGQDRPTISTILSPSTPAGSLATNNTNQSPNTAYPSMVQGQQMSSEVAAMSTLQPWPSSDPTNVAVRGAVHVNH